MKHLSEEELVMYHYGEVEEVAPYQAHLAACTSCATEYEVLKRVLDAASDFPVPGRGDEYGEQVWRRLEGSLPKRRGWLAVLFAPRVWALAGSMAGLMIAAFFIGRISIRRPVPAAPVAAEQVRERVLLVAVGDHLERSQMVLLELANAQPQAKTDISMEKSFAADLVDTNRLYRQTAADTGDKAIASVLDELERVLLEISHSPSEVSAAQLKKIQERIESQGILFKVRVIGSQVRKEEARPAREAGRNAL